MEDLEEDEREQARFDRRMEREAKEKASLDELISCLLAYVEIEETSAPYSSSPLRERSRSILAAFGK